MKTDLEKATIGTCDQCNKENVKVRRIESKGSDFGGGSRGFFYICFKCIKPIIRFYSKRLKRWMETPITDYKEE